jgi:hypothetical protein
LVAAREKAARKSGFFVLKALELERHRSGVLLERWGGCRRITGAQVREDRRKPPRRHALLTTPSRAAVVEQSHDLRVHHEAVLSAAENVNAQISAQAKACPCNATARAENKPQARQKAALGRFAS